MFGPIVDFPTTFTIITLFLVAKQTISPELDPKVHRLQRQDVRSRKTFKRRKATKAPSMKRLGGHGYPEDTSEGEAGSSESSPARRAYSMRRTNQRDTLTSYQDRSAYVREISRSHQGFTSHPGFPELSRSGNTRSSWGSGTATERNRTQHRSGQGQLEHEPPEEEIKVPQIYCSSLCLSTEWTGIFLSMLWISLSANIYFKCQFNARSKSIWNGLNCFLDIFVKVNIFVKVMHSK